MAKNEVVKPKEALKKEVREKAHDYVQRYASCSQCTLLALQEVLGLDDELTFKATSCLGGGLALTGNTCGALTAGVMVIGMKCGRANIEGGLGEVLKGMLPAYRLVRWFQDEFGAIACREIAGIEIEDEEKMKGLMADPESLKRSLDLERVAKSFQLVGKTAEKVVELINEED